MVILQTITLQMLSDKPVEGEDEEEEEEEGRLLLPCVPVNVINRILNLEVVF